MVAGAIVSKALAVGIGTMTAVATVSLVTMVIIYSEEIKRNKPVPPIDSTTPLPMEQPPNLRLPRNLVPIRYAVYLQPHFYTRLSNITNQTFIFSGNSTVHFTCLNATKRIIMHSKNLNISSYSLRVANDEIDIENFSLWNNESNFMDVVLQKPLEAKKNYTFFTQFEGKMSDDLVGLYISKYTEDGEDRVLATTQMKPTHARKVFPCFDEPSMKAEFDITIIHREKTKALSNAKIKNTGIVNIDGEEWYVTYFQSTPKMSTYLLTFTVSEFIQAGTDKNGIWARPDAVTTQHTKYALDQTSKIIPFYEAQFGLTYPLHQLDQIAVPDFSTRGTESWGMISYQETALLYDENLSSTFNKEQITTVIAHEMAHQWFGNLVTMKWWNDLWLSEGLATYISYFSVNKIEPTWNIMDLFVLYEMQPVMQVDSLMSSHPLSPKEEDVQTTSDIVQLFNPISYSKGAAVLRMLSAYLSDNIFQKGVKSFLHEYQQRNAEHEDFWRHLQMAVGNNNKRNRVEDLMKEWIEQMGYPVITINTTSGEISQQHFLLNQTPNNSIIWQVPIKYMQSGSTVSDDLLTTDSERKPIYITEKDEWLLANVNYTGYFRVNYNPENWERLLMQLESDHKIIPVINRAQLIDDAFNLARAKYINSTLALNTTKYLSNETDYIPWQSALQNLEYFTLMFDRSEVYSPMQAYMRKQVENLYRYFKLNTENLTVPHGHTEQYNQINAISVACSNELENCTEMVSRYFQEWMRNSSENVIPANLKSTIYCNAIAAGGEKEWNFAWEKYLNATMATEKDELRYALSCTKTLWLLNRYLSYTLDPDKIRKMDFVSTINYIARNVIGQSLAWDFVQFQWSYISREYGSGTVPLGSLIDGVTKRFSTESELKQLRQFQMDHKEELFSAAQALQQAIERTEANIKWVKENQQVVLEWFHRENQQKK